ncbi:hypothetical protein SO802_006007 [Lithocarpus litseifolius]|uniref:Uncharacterized protein n=1 Tax=Lithocarpus litseifolius TaxID=425828 RepID=A0AAW2DN00_9ROSI
MHILMALSCKCVQIKFLASSQNSAPRRTLPKFKIFSEKAKPGTPIVLAIPGFDPLVLPRSIQGISEAPGPKALEATLPSPVIISLKMFSLAPNLQTQKGVVIRMPKPFPYKDSHLVPWKYDVTLIFTRTRKEEVYTNISSSIVGLTRGGRCYTPEAIEKRGKRISRAQPSHSGIGSPLKKLRNS